MSGCVQCCPARTATPSAIEHLRDVVRVHAVDVQGHDARAALGQYGHVVLELLPGEPASGIVFENSIVGGVIPREYIPAIEKGVREAAEGGIIAGYPATDIKIRLYDGSYHEVDSNEMAFKMAGSLAFKEGAAKGKPILQEPIMKVEVSVPEEFLGEIIGQLNSRRGEILGMEIRPGNTQAVRAMVPLAEMFGYATNLRSVTQGR